MSVTPKSGKHGQGIANTDCTPTTSESPSPLAGGHKASFRSTKLARRARSFKEDFLEKISQMRSPPTNNSGGGGGGIMRPHSPRAAITRHGHATSADDKNPTREVELMVRQVQVALKHFRDVVSKDKLEMLPGNGTIVLDTVLAIVSSMRPLLGGEPQSSAALGSATHHVYQSLARLIKLCDDVLLNGRQSSALAPDNVTEIVTLLEDAVQELVLVAKDKLSQGQKQPNAMHQVPGAAVVTAVATRLDLPAQRNSLPDIPLTPRERQNLEQKSGSKGSANALGPGGATTVRSSHSTESVLRGDSPTPPPKPPLPSGLCLPDAEVASLGTPPPLPPKKRSQRAHQLIGECCTSDSSLLGYSCDRVSFRSRSPEDSSSLLSASAGSLDSVLNNSREEDEIRALMGHTHTDDGRRENDISDIPYTTHLNHNYNGGFDDSFQPLAINHNQSDVNRLSNTDSGFASIHSHRNSVHSFSTSKRSSQQSSSSQWSASQQNSFKQQVHATSTTAASFEIDEHVSYSHTEKVTAISQHSSLSSSQMSDLSVVQPITGDDSLEEVVPPAIPQKTRSRRGRHERQPSPYDNVPLDNMAGELIPCLMHQTQTSTATVSSLSDTENAKPPPLPVKKRHIMAYMEMFGNCSHSNDNEFMRHSMHMVQAQWQNQHQQSLDSGLTTTQSCSFVHTTTSSTYHTSSSTSTTTTLTTLTPPPSLDHHRLSPGQVSPARSVSPITNYISLPPALPPKRLRATKSPPPSLDIPVTITQDNEQDDSTSPTKPTDIENEELNHIDVDDIKTRTNNNKLSPKMNRESSPLSASTPTPINSQKLSPGDVSAKSTDTESIVNNDMDLIEELDICKFIVLKKSEEDGPEIRGGYTDALIVQATNTNIKADDSEDFSYQEAFLTTYRTFISPNDLITKLIRRHQHFNCQPDRKARAREAFSLLVRVVKDLTVSDLETSLVQMVMDFICQLVCSGSLTQAKLLRVTLIEKYNAKILQNKMLNQQATLTLVAASATLLEFKSEQIAEQMTLLDADLFMKIEIPEVLIWAQEQNEERSPNLTRFTEHFNKMSYWARTKILQSEAKDREKYVMKFIKIMKHLRKINNFNSYLALLSALDSAPIRRLEWQKHITEGLKEYCALIDSSSSFRAYRQALAETSPPCIPYIGLVLQDLTFVHIGNSNLLPDGTVNFSKRWQQFNIVENMKRFKKCTYTFKKNERIIAFFRNFDDFIGEDAMWQISESIKPRGGKKPA